MKRFALLLVAALVSSARAGDLSWETAVEEIKATIEPAEAKPGQTVKYKLAIKLAPGLHTYPTVQPDPSSTSKNKIELPKTGNLIFVEPVSDPPDFAVVNRGGITQAEYEGGATWEFKAVVSPKASPGPANVEPLTLKMIVCDESGCLPPKTFKVPANLTVAVGSVPVDPKFKDAVDKAIGDTASPPLPLPKDPSPPGKGPNGPREGSKPEGPKAPPQDAEGPKAVTRKLSAAQDHAADLKDVLDRLPPPDTKGVGFGTFIATAAFWGILTLLTPCVFPMVPITVTIFLKQSEKQGTNVLALALVYAVTIVVLLSVAAMFLLTTFSRLAVNPVTNVLLGGLFVALALSLFGLFEITLPSSVATALDNKAAQGGYIGTIFMAASFTVVSFTCVAPFLGGFSGMTASGKFSTAELAAGAVAFALAFASPFFLLALFPSLIKKLPKSGDWMNMVKVTMGFLELAAALKFFRTAELRWLTPPQYFTYDFVLASYVAILVAMALYLFGVFRTKHDHEMHDHVGPWRIMFALTALGLGTYLLPGLFGNGPKDRNRPGGIVYAWVDSFLLPEPSAAEVISGELPWSADLKQAIENARGKNGRVFVDFTGVTCTNCKLNEKNVFPHPEVQELFKQYTLVQMYTDEIPAVFYEADPGSTRRESDAEANLDFQKRAFGDEKLPLYVILKPEPGAAGRVSVMGVYREGKINDEPAFVQFLKDGLK
jgi:thiol:disulfide interchange protein DsbD